jgi:hypothetical protein
MGIGVRERKFFLSQHDIIMFQAVCLSAVAYIIAISNMRIKPWTETDIYEVENPFGHGTI